MTFRFLAFSLLIISTVSYAQGRKPAVEDFVGIEIEESEVTPQGSEALFNLQQDIKKIEEQKPSAKQTESLTQPSPVELSPSFFFGFALALSLPMIVWFLVMAHLKKKASVESASNIEVLEKYRREREKKSEEKIRKAS